MRQIVRKIREEILPLFQGNRVALVESVIRIMAGGNAPGTRRAAGSDKLRKLERILNGTKPDATFPGVLYEFLVDEAGSSAKQGRRRRGGIFYTPQHITKYLVSSSFGYYRSKDDSAPRIIDPACGCGAFLIEAYRQLTEALPGLSSREILESCIHGIDSDPDAVHIARLSLWLESGCDEKVWPILKKNIQTGDSLREFLETPEENQFDIVIGNPPYRNVKRGIPSATKEFLKTHYETVHGQWDISAPFIELGLRHLLTADGILAYIIPSPIFSAENYIRVRQIVMEYDLLEFGPAGKAFSDPGVEAGLLLVRRGLSTGKRVRSIGVGKKGGEILETGKISKPLINRLPNIIFSHRADGKFLTPILDGMDTGRLCRLSDRVKIARGLETGKSDERIVAAGSRGSKGFRKLLTGEGVSEFRLGAKYLFNLHRRRRENLKSEELWSGDSQLLVRRVAPYPIAAVSSPPMLALNTLYILYGEGFNRHSLCALINSEMFRRIFVQLFAFDDSLFPYLRISQLNFMPIPPSALNDAALAVYSKDLHELKRNAGSHDGIAEDIRSDIDRLVERLYSEA